MIPKFLSKIGRSIDNAIDKTPDAKAAFLPFQALFFIIIGIVVFISEPKYLLAGFVMLGIGSLGLLIFIGIIGEKFFLLLAICEFIGLATFTTAVIFLIQHGYSPPTVTFVAFGLWYLTFGTLWIFLPDEAEKNWWILACAHIILLTGASFVGAFTSPSSNWITFPLPLITIAITVFFIFFCIIQHQQKKHLSVGGE
jgi:hypothetical protein